MKNHRSPSLVFALILACFLALGTSARAQSYSTNDGAWSNASTWNTPPVDGLSAVVTGGNTVTFDAGDSYTGSSTWWNGLGVGGGVEYGPAGAGTLNITGGTLTSGGMWAGHGGTGTINLSGGTLNIGGQHMLFGWNFGSTLNVSGGTLNMTGSGNLFRFGNSGQSFMNVTSNGVANLTGLGIDLLVNSQINVAGGTLNLTNTTETNSIVNVAAGSQMLVNNGGVVNLLAGTQTIGVAEGFYLGHGGSTGTLNISGGTWQQNTYMRLGVFASGNGIINQSGGTFEMAGADAGGSFEAWGDSPSAYNLQGGTFRVMTNGVQINTYSGGAMTFNITGSSGNVTMDMPYDFTAPNSSVFNNSAATLTKTGTGTLTFGNASLLDIRNGALDLQTGTIETASTLAIGSSGGTASATMTDGTLRTGYLGLANFTVGFGGTGSLTQSNGAVDVGSQANTIIGWNADGTGTYTLNGGTYSAVTNNTFIGFSGGTGTVNVNGGSFAAHNLLVGGNDAASGTLNLNGGTLSLANPDGFYVDSNGTLNLNSGGSLPAANLRVTSGGNLNFNGGAGNEVLNIFAGGGAGGTVDVNGQTLGAGSWANLIASGTGAVLRNSSGNATIAAANTIWIWDGGTSLTIDASGGDVQIDSRITSSGQTTPTGIIKTGANNLVLTYANDYTGITAINEGRVALANGNALGSTSGGTIVASGAQLLLTNVVVVAEPLTISGNGLSSGQAIAGALRSFGTNTYQGKITLGANAKIFGGSGTSLAVDVASGDAVDLSGNTLTIDGAGSLLINDGITGAGGLTKEGSGVATFAGVNTYTGTTTVSLGTLVVSNVSLSATISSDSVAVAFASAPSAGTTYTVLPGPLAANSLVSPSVTGLGSGQTAIVTNDPNLVVKVSAANGYSSWLNGQPTNSANQLAYAIGGATSPTATNGVASVTTVTSNTLSITAIVRTNDPNLAVYGQSILDLAVGTWTTNDVTNSVPVDQSGATPGTTQKQTFTTPYATNNAKKFLRLQTTLSSQ